MATREELHRLVDAIDEARLGLAAGYLAELAARPPLGGGGGGGGDPGEASIHQLAWKEYERAVRSKAAGLWGELSGE